MRTKPTHPPAVRDPHDNTLGEVAFDAYVKSAACNNEVLQPWSSLPDWSKEAWYWAAIAVVEKVWRERNSATVARKATSNT